MKQTVVTSVVASVLFILGGSAGHAGSKTAPNILVQTEWQTKHLSDQHLVVLHVGVNRKSYESAHIPGARFLAINDIVVTRNGIPNELPGVNELKATFERLGIGDKSRVVIYGDEMGLLAARTYFTLDYLGHGKRSAMLDGGMEKWRAEKTRAYDCHSHRSWQSETDREDPASINC